MHVRVCVGGTYTQTHTRTCRDGHRYIELQEVRRYHATSRARKLEGYRRDPHIRLRADELFAQD